MNHTSALNPIIFIGMPRSGTTIVQEALSAHESLGWLSNYTAHFPRFPMITFVHRLFGNLQGQRSQGQKLSPLNRFYPRPAETYGIWEILLGRKFLFSFLQGVSPSEEEKRNVIRYINRILLAQNKDRFCTKFTGPPRMEFLSTIFPEACFVDMVRDPRAVIASLMVDKDDFWERKGGISGPFWEGALSEDKLGVWEDSGRSPVVLAALQWVAVYEQTRQEREKTGAKYIQVTYEAFTANPKKIMDQLCQYCDLAPSTKLDQYISSIHYSSKNKKFSSLFSEQEITWIEEIAAEPMKDLGYSRISDAE